MPSTAGKSAPPSVTPLSLRRNCSWFLTANLVNMACQWGRVVLLAHLAGVEMVGTVVLAFAICAPVNVLAYLGLRGTVATDTRGEYAFGDYFALRLIMAAMALLIVVGIVAASAYRGQTAWIILVVAVGELFRSVSDIFHALFQQHERMDRMAISVMLRGGLMLALLAVGVLLTGSVLWGMVGFPLAMAATFFAFDLPTGARIVRNSPLRQGVPDGSVDVPRGGLRPRFDVRTMLRLAWLALPLGVAMMMVSLASSIPRYMVGHYLGLHTLGVFVMILYLAMVGSKLGAAMSQSAGPRLAKLYAAGDLAAYRRLLVNLLAVTAGMGVAVVAAVAVVGGPILGLIYGAGFSRHAPLAVYLMVAGVMMYMTTPLSQAIDAMRRFKTHLAMRVAGIVALLAAAPGLIEAYGLKGAAMGMFLGYATTVLGCTAVVLWAVRPAPRKRTDKARFRLPATGAAQAVPP